MEVTRTVICAGGSEFPGDKSVVARVFFDDGSHRDFMFGADVRFDWMRQFTLPMLIRDQFGKRKRRTKD
jgi:hypothetical protein